MDTARWKWGDIRLIQKLGLHQNCNFLKKLKDAFDHRLHRAGKAFETHRHCNFYLGRVDVLRTLLGRETKVLLKDTEWEELPSGPGKCVFLFYFLWTERSVLIMSFPCVNHQDRLSGKCTPPSVILRTNFSPAFILPLPVSLDLFLPFFPLSCMSPLKLYLALLPFLNDHKIKNLILFSPLSSYVTLDRRQRFAQSCLTLCDPTDCSLPGSSVHGVLQARVLEWVVIPFSRGSSRPRAQTWFSHVQADSLAYLSFPHFCFLTYNIGMLTFTKFFFFVKIDVKSLA